MRNIIFVLLNFFVFALSASQDRLDGNLEESSEQTVSDGDETDEENLPNRFRIYDQIGLPAIGNGNGNPDQDLLFEERGNPGNVTIVPLSQFEIRRERYQRQSNVFNLL